MDNKHAADLLRKEAQDAAHHAEWKRDFDNGDRETWDYWTGRAKSFSAGADALGLLEWLFEKPEGMLIWPQGRVLYQTWLDKGAEGDFRAFCEAKWREGRGA